MTTSRGATTSATQAAYEQLKHLVLTCQLAPGTEIREAQLAELTGFGRTPIRDALRRLVHDDLVQVRPRQGYQVAPLTMDSIRELFEMRLLLEPAAVEFAIARADDQGLADLTQLLPHEPHDRDPEVYSAFLAEHRHLHVRIAELGGNRRLARSLRLLLEEMQRLMFAALHSHVWHGEPPHDHGELLEAMVARDATRARSISIEQIEYARRSVLEALADPTRLRTAWEVRP